MNAKTLIIILLPALICASCATILNTKTQQIFVETDKHIKVVSIDSSLRSSNIRNSFYVERNKTPLKIKLQVDSVQKTIAIKSKNSFAFWLNVFYNYGLGMLVDMNNPKRYSYPKRIYLLVKNDSVQLRYLSTSQVGNNKIALRHFVPPQKGMVDYHVALPYGNLYYLKTMSGKESLGGFFGFETGVDYYYKNNQFVSAYVGAATNFPIPVIAPLDYWGFYEGVTTAYVSVRNNYTLGRIHLGYGISYSRLVWRKTNDIDSSFIPQEKKNSAFGLSFSSGYRVGKFFQLGLIYQPYFLSIDNRVNFSYQHQAAVELIWKIPMKR